ncbi:uncharacterized protein K441DRAFT_637992, partial [Cenococcum geophilum 1.58]|uniref:uncharacterized protein n=1 Tax=Cenococcum geophilum 1.58 TaxID=794803 RepID=UPI00358EAEFA
MHLDLAADSVNNNPNPKIRDLSIKFTYGTGHNRGTKSKWTKVYGPKLAKILARFQPFGAGATQTGYFIQRSAESLTLFALARYVQKLYGYYSHIPAIYDQINEIPMIPPNRDEDIYSVFFVSDNNNPVTLVNFTAIDNGTRAMNDFGDCTTVLDQSSGLEDVDIGAPNAADQYPQSYWDDRNRWLQEIKDYAESRDSKQCKLSIVEVWTCEDVSKNLYA